ncbi:MAG: hypothetical protein HQM09_13155 [Candidatus Riflebacteria bacterium]|nr:hypothetical protein [Candidatus Riflebacteria bacterium]
MSDKDIIQELQAPIKTFRIYALEKAISSGSSQDLLNSLEKFRIDESDEECQILFTHAVSAVRDRINTKLQPTPGQKISEANLPEIFPTLEIGKKLNIITSLKPDQIKKLAHWAVSTIEAETNPAIASRIIKVFAGHWPPERLDVLLTRLQQGFLTIRCSALEAVTLIAPLELTRHLPALLSSDDPLIRALAISGLMKIDPDEGKNHLDKIFLGTDRAQKMAALQISVLLPFPLVKSLLLKFLVVEKDVQLIEKAGLALQINPDPEVPFSLLEIMEKSPPVKIPFLKTIFDGASKTIQTSGILQDKFPEYLKRLRDHIQKRKALNTVRSALLNLESEDQGEREESAAFLLHAQDKLHLQEILQEKSAPNISPGQKKKLDDFFTTGSNQTSQANLKNPGIFNNLSLSEQLCFLSRLQVEDKETGILLLPNIIKDEKAPATIRAVALKTASRIGMTDFIEQAKRWLYHNEESIVAASLDYLSKFDPEKAFPLLGKFLSAGNPRIRIAALKILEQNDPVQAVSSVMAMLKNPGKHKRDIALSYIANFDFALIRDQLTELVESTRDETIIDDVLTIFQCNPHPENLFLLFRLEKIFPEDISKKILSVRNTHVTMIETLQIIGAAELKELLSGLESKWEHYRNSKSVPPPYSVRALQQAEAGFLEKLKNTIWPFCTLKMAFFLAFIILVLSLGITFLSTDERDQRKIPSGGLIAVPVEITGTVTEIMTESEDIIIKADDQTVIQLRSPGKNILKIGDRIKAVIKPFRFSDGIIQARFVSFEKS